MNVTVPEPPPQAELIFGDQLNVAVQYVELLATDGVVRGLLGPREVPKLWDRHVLNCAVIEELIKPNESVVDVGSGAGLPGIALAIVRPDLAITLVEPLARRVSFLTECQEQLGLKSVRVHRGRAEEPATISLAGSADVVTARAVAPLDRLTAWCLPLIRPGGRMLAIKGVSAETEIKEHAGAVMKQGATDIVVRSCGVNKIDPPTRVVVMTRGSAPVKSRGVR